MKKLYKLIMIAALCAVSTVASAQIESGYFMYNTPINNSINPAFRPDRGYVGIPFISGVSAKVEFNGIKMKDFVFKKNGEYVNFMDDQVSTSEFLKNIKENNRIGVETNVKILSAGWYKGVNFWTVDVGSTGFAGVSIPKEILRMTKENDFDQTYDVKDYSVAAQVYSYAGVGLSRPINDKLTVGAKLKYIAGSMNLNMKIDRFYAEPFELPDGTKVWNAELKGEMNVSGKGVDFKYEDDPSGERYISGVDVPDDAFAGVSGHGAAVDLGATYKLKEKLVLSAAVTDLGFIAWKSSATKRAVADARTTDFTGFDSNAELSEVADKIMEVGKYHEIEGAGNTTMTNTKVLLGGEYSVLDNKIGFGLLSYTRFYQNFAMSDLTASTNFRPTKWFSGSLSYSIVRSRLGVGINFHPSWINFYFGMDNVPYTYYDSVPVSNGANFYVGLAIPLTKKPQ